MFGYRKKTTDQDTQIPYQVYETVQEPAARRKRWMIRLIAGLLIATLLVMAAVTLRNRYSQDGKAADPSVKQTQLVQQSPQSNTPQQQPDGQPSKSPLSDSTNDKTVSQPQ